MRDGGSSSIARDAAKTDHWESFIKIILFHDLANLDNSRFVSIQLAGGKPAHVVERFRIDWLAVGGCKINSYR